jgi:hypothetical protein
MKNCKYCGQELPVGTHGKREFCDDAHKQKYYRQQHQQDQTEALLAEVAQLRTQVKDQAFAIEELGKEVTRLRSLLDIERAYLADTKRRGFKAWIKKQPSSAFIQKLLADSLLPVQDTRSHYEYRLRYLLHCTDDELLEFTQLWKLMLLSRS